MDEEYYKFLQRFWLRDLAKAKELEEAEAERLAKAETSDAYELAWLQKREWQKRVIFGETS